jgi:acetyl esterase/lipase
MVPNCASANGRRTESTRYNGTIHDFVLLNALRELPETKAALQQVGDGVRDALEARDGVRAALNP